MSRALLRSCLLCVFAVACLTNFSGTDWQLFTPADLDHIQKTSDVGGSGGVLVQRELECWSVGVKE